VKEIAMQLMKRLQSEFITHEPICIKKHFCERS